ncbi:MAG TPA: imidazole glycerol phosphate synthase subunit HisF [Saprospiraceae bacterium]|nr:imidazole glycerol phosphate synthase subunit HisF [Saprospiraceae bacterium]
MLTKRIIPCLDIKDGRTVKGTNFVALRDAGDPVELAATYAEAGADELVFLDISATHEGRTTLIDLVKKVGAVINIPFSVGGGINSKEIVYDILQSGADKVSVNSSAIARPALIEEISTAFGVQCVIVAIDAKCVDGQWMVHTHGGRKNVGLDLFEWAQQAESRGAGEILFTSMDHDGTKDGYALEALQKLNDLVNIPVIASGGAGKKEDFLDVLHGNIAQAALAASVFHYQEIKIPELKRYLADNGISIRI